MCEKTKITRCARLPEKGSRREVRSASFEIHQQRKKRVVVFWGCTDKEFCPLYPLTDVRLQGPGYNVFSVANHDFISACQ